MSSIVTAVFKATIGLLVNKGRDKAAEKLKDGDVTDQKFRKLIVREIDDIKSKLDGLSRKDLLASISFFEEGIELLYEVFDKAKPRSRSENDTDITQATCAEAFSLAEGMNKLELTDLDESATRVLTNAKKRFEDARREATRAFRNEALETSDRILAMQYRVMATILETVDNPADAVAPCRVCVKELNSLPAVQNSFFVQLSKGIQVVKSLFGKDERKQIVSSVCQVNRVIYDVAQAVGKDISFWNWPTVSTHKGTQIDPLRDEGVTKFLRKQGMEHCCVTPWTFGQERKRTLEFPCAISTNTSGEFVVAEEFDNNVKVFDRTGVLINTLSVPNDDENMKLHIDDVATDMLQHIYVLAWRKTEDDRFKSVIYTFKSSTDAPKKLPLMWRGYRLTVTNTHKVLVLCEVLVDVYNTDGQFVRAFGERVLKSPFDITSANDGRAIVLDLRDPCVQIFSEHGEHLNTFQLQECYSWKIFPRIAFYGAGEHVVVTGEKRHRNLHVEIYTKDGEFVRSTQVHEEVIESLLYFDFDYFRGMSVTMDGSIAVVVNGEVLVV